MSATGMVMTVTDEMLAEIELLASKATQGKWWIDSHGHTMMATDTLDVVFCMPSTKGAVRHPETGNLSCWRNDWDASYIAAANPQNMQSLLSELRRLRAENAELAKDAGRYRFLRDKEAERGPSVVDIACWTAGATCIALTYVDADDVDGAVDIAMAAQ